MAWCEAHMVDYVLAMPRNSRLKTLVAEEMAQAKSQYEATECTARVVGNFRYQMLKSGSCEHRVIGKVDRLAKGGNSRFVLTTLSTEQWDACNLYEDLYCARVIWKIASRHSTGHCLPTTHQPMRCVPLSCGHIFPSFV